MNGIHYFIALSFFTVLGIISVEYYQNITAIQHGLQQCQVWNPEHTRYEVLWKEICE